MRLPELLGAIPRNFIIAGTAVAALLIGAAVAFSTGGGDDNNTAGRRATPVSQAQGAVTTPTVVPTATPVRTPTPAGPTPVPDRTNCDQIRGTDYRSATEQAWFQANCTGARPSTTPGTPVATATRSATTPSTAQTQPQPAAPAAPAAPQVQTYTGVESPTGMALVIPKANINADILVTGMDAGKMPDPKTYFGALSYDMSGYPGLGGNVDVGNLVMSGHVDCGHCYNGGSGIAIFWYARDLAPGDTASIYLPNGGVQNYVVTSSGSYSSQIDYTPFVASGAADMTIITCTGTFGGGEYDKRHVVQFRKI